MKKIRTWYNKCRQEGTADVRYLLLWFMVAVFPLLVIPHPFYISFPAGVVPPGYFYLPRYVILGMVALAALIILLKDRVQVNHPVFIPLVFFIVFLMISSFLAPIPLTAWIGSPFRFTGASTYFFCIILFILAQTSRKTEQLLGWLAAAAAVVSVLALLQYFGVNLVPHEPGRAGLIAYGTMPHPNFLGTYTAFILPAPVLLFGRTKKIPWLVCAALIYAGLLVSLCRNAWLASLAGFLIIVCSVWKKPEQRKAFLLLCLVFLVVTAALLPARDGTLLARIFSVSGELSSGVRLEDDAGTYRLYIWRQAVKLLPQFWAFGIGPDHLIYGHLVTPIREIADKAHNIYLEILVTMGVFATLSYLAFLSYFLSGWKSGTGFIFFVMIAVYLVQGFFNIDVVMIMPLFWIVLGLSLAERKKAAALTSFSQRSGQCAFL